VEGCHKKEEEYGDYFEAANPRTLRQESQKRPETSFLNYTNKITVAHIPVWTTF
jgi:hypothetical protein